MARNQTFLSTRWMLDPSLPLVFQPPPHFEMTLRQEVEAALRTHSHQFPASKTSLVASSDWPNGLEVSGLTWKSRFLLSSHVCTPREVLLTLFRKRLGHLEAEKSMNAIKALKLSDFFQKNGKRSSFAVTCSCQKSELRKSRVLKTWLEGLLNEESPPEHLLSEASDQVSLRASLWRDRLTIAVPIRLFPFHHGKYKFKMSHSASLREDIAQCLIQSHYKWVGFEDSRDFPEFGDFPFCGSGTLALEWVWAKEDVPRVTFDPFLDWEGRKAAPGSMLKHIQTRALSHAIDFSADQPFKSIIHLQASDKDIHSVAILKQTISNLFEQSERALESNRIQVNQEDVMISQKVVKASARESLFFALNPPWGHRLQTQSKEADWSRRLAQVLRGRYPVDENGPRTHGFILLPESVDAMRFLKIWSPPRLQKHRAWRLSIGGEPVTQLSVVFGG